MWAIAKALGFGPAWIGIERPAQQAIEQFNLYDDARWVAYLLAHTELMPAFYEAMLKTVKLKPEERIKKYEAQVKPDGWLYPAPTASRIERQRKQGMALAITCLIGDPSYTYLKAAIASIDRQIQAIIACEQYD